MGTLIISGGDFTYFPAIPSSMIIKIYAFIREIMGAHTIVRITMAANTIVRITMGATTIIRITMAANSIVRVTLGANTILSVTMDAITTAAGITIVIIDIIMAIITIVHLMVRKADITVDTIKINQ
jgi:hypothetical protein